MLNKIRRVELFLRLLVQWNIPGTSNLKKEMFYLLKRKKPRKSLMLFPKHDLDFTKNREICRRVVNSSLHSILLPFK